MKKMKKIYFINYFQPILLDCQQKFGHSIPGPLDLGNYNVKWPLYGVTCEHDMVSRCQSDIHIRRYYLLSNQDDNGICLVIF